MKKRIFFLLIILILLAAAMTACGMFGSPDGKAELSEDMFFCSYLDNLYVYTGEPITFRDSDFIVRLKDRNVAIDLFDIEYRDNVNAGQASVILTAKSENKFLKGSVTLHFTILPNGSINVEKGDDLAAILADPSVSGVMMWTDYTIPEGATLTVPVGKSINMIYGYRFQNHGSFVNEGTIVMRGALLSTGGRRASEFTNYGTFVNHGTMEIKDYVTINDRGSFTSDTEIVNRGTVYLLDEDKPFFKDTDGGIRYVRLPLKTEDLSVERCVYTQGNMSYLPRITATERTAEFAVEYSNNTHAGEGQATVTMEEYDVYYYGSVTIPFTIEKGQATATNYEQLADLISSENYLHYSISSLDIPSGKTLNLPGGETLTVSNTITVNGSLTSEGEITCGKFDVKSGGSVVNDAMLTVTGNTFSISGTFTNGEHGDWTYDTTKASLGISGTFINKGTVLNKTFGTITGTLRNEGVLSASGLPLLNGAFVNNGEATFSAILMYSFASSKDPSFRNEGQGVVTVSESGIFNGEFVNDGTFLNKGELSFADGIDYSCNGTFDNTEGEVYAFGPLSGISDRIHRRRYLTDDEVDFRVEYLETPYNRGNQKPSFTVDGASLNSADYTIKYRYSGATKDTTECVNAGEINVRISFNNYFSIYAGTREFTYKIVPATIHVTQKSFGSAANSTNYGKLILDEDITIRYSGTIGSWCTLDLNGHRLFVGKKDENTLFYMYGELIGGAPVDPDDFVPSEEAACIIVESGSDIWNYGRIDNYGFIYLKGYSTLGSRSAAASEYASGVLVNHGVIYTCYSVATDSSSTGRVVQREFMSEMYLYITVSDVVYDGTPQTPVPTFIYHDEPVDLSRFTLTYYNNIEANYQGRVVLETKDPFDELFWGSSSASFTVKRGTAEVNNASAFAAAASNENYEKIRLVSDVTLNEAVTLSNNQTIDLSSYEIYFGEKGSLTYGYYCRLILTADNKTRFLKYVYAADEITLTADMSERIALDFSEYDSAFIEGENLLSTVVHMNGHSFIGGIDIGNGKKENYAFEFENSSDDPSAFGTANSGTIGLNYLLCSEETFVTLRNVTVYSMVHKGGYGTAQDAKVTAYNCCFVASSDANRTFAYQNNALHMSVEGVFTECTFVGNGAFYSMAGEYTFDSCTFTATGTYDKKNNPYVDAMTFDYGGFWGFEVTIENCILTSADGNGIQVLNRNNAVHISYDNDTYQNITVPVGKAKTIG